MSTREGDLSGHLRGHDGPSYPHDPLSELFFYPIQGMMGRSYQKPILHGDTYRLATQNSSEYSWIKFDRIWKSELAKEKPDLRRALLRFFAVDLFWILLMWVAWSGLQYTTPLLLPHLTNYFLYSSLPAWWGYVYLGAIWASSFMTIVLFNNIFYQTWTVGARVRSILINLLYRKSLTATSSALSSRGQIMNLMSTDASMILDTLPYFIEGCLAPIQFIVTVGLLSREIGVFSLIPLAFLAIALPTIHIVGTFQPKYRMKVQQAADIRMKLTTEFISAIRIVKYYAWERPFLQKIDEARENEIKSLKMVTLLQSLLLGILISLPVLCIGFTIFFYSIRHPFQIGSLFAAISYLAYLKFPFIFAPLAVSFGIQYNVSLSRIQEYCMNEDMDPITFDADPKDIGGMRIENGSFTFDKSNTQLAPALADINLEVPRGNLVIIVGGVGSGKSTLANAFLKELTATQGSVFVASPISFASQEPFLVNMTIRENITFGNPYDPEWYQEVIKACALTTDLQLFPAGDMTEIAEKGSNLSGGQRQRVNVARALYSNRENFIFDDPFSAVDAHVGDHMFKHAVLPLAKDKGKTVLLITNQLQFLPYADSIAVLDHGRIVEQGGYLELLNNNGKLYELAKEYGLITFDGKIVGLSTSAGLRRSNARIEEDERREELEKAQTAQKSPEDDAKNKELGAIISAEKSSLKAIAHTVYTFVFTSGGLGIWGLIILVNLLRIGVNVGQNIWLSLWADPSNHMSKGLHMGIYVLLFVGESILAVIFASLVGVFVINISRNTHRRLLKSIAHATTAFFDKTPLGRLLSRFSKDISVIDTFLPLQLQYTTDIVTLILAVVVNMAVASKYAVIIVLFGLAVFLVLLLFFRRTSIQVQRLEAISRAPIFTHFGETLDGLATVRAYGMTDNFITALMNKVDYNAMDFLTLRRLNQWFNMCSNQVLNIIINGVLLLVILLRNYTDTLNVGFAISAIANSVPLVIVIGNLALQYSEFEARMNAPERVLEYNNVEQERAYEIPETKPGDDWPANGKVHFNDLTIAYKPGVPVLHGLEAKIRPREKIGIVGRTGAGKSTLITALFRTTEPASGTVLLDDIDIDRLGLFDLRRKLSIIPQVPQLFMGDVRYNLDPFGEHSDDELWKVLDMVSLKDFISAMPNGLDSQVEENGSNFSVGQRQLISMARCLLFDTRILLLDEATASLDVQSDALLQRMIRTHFKDRTVLTIAHRLITIIDNDRVMVLDQGRIVEFDTPKKLLKKKGVFYGMVQATGHATAAHLTAIANGEAKVTEVIEEDPASLLESSIDE